jgi:hypothetical protein
VSTRDGRKAESKEIISDSYSMEDIFEAVSLSVGNCFKEVSWKN